MELAGLSVASALRLCIALVPRRVLIMAGPGNNGGDELVAGRHLHHFGYEVEVLYPKRTDKPIYAGLVTQLETLGVRFVEVDHVTENALVTLYDVVVDAMFGSPSLANLARRSTNCWRCSTLSSCSRRGHILGLERGRGRCQRGDEA